MNAKENEIIVKFESHARSPDLVPHLMAKEQIAILEKIAKGIDATRKEIVQLRADVKQEQRKKTDDGNKVN